MRRDQVQRAEEEQRRLSVMLQVQYVLCSLQRHDVRKIFSMREHAHLLSAQEVEKLLNLASLLACKRDESMRFVPGCNALLDVMTSFCFVFCFLFFWLKCRRTWMFICKHAISVTVFCLCRLEDQMEQASLVYLDLLDGIDKPVAGSTCAFTLIINLF